MENQAYLEEGIIQPGENQSLLLNLSQVNQKRSTTQQPSRIIQANQKNISKIKTNINGIKPNINKLQINDISFDFKLNKEKTLKIVTPENLNFKLALQNNIRKMKKFIIKNKRCPSSDNLKNQTPFNKKFQSFNNTISNEEIRSSQFQQNFIIQNSKKHSSSTSMPRTLLDENLKVNQVNGIDNELERDKKHPFQDEDDEDFSKKEEFSKWASVDLQQTYSINENSSSNYQSGQNSYDPTPIKGFVLKNQKKHNNVMVSLNGKQISSNYQILCTNQETNYSACSNSIKNSNDNQTLEYNEEGISEIPLKEIIHENKPFINGGGYNKSVDYNSGSSSIQAENSSFIERQQIQNLFLKTRNNSIIDHQNSSSIDSCSSVKDTFYSFDQREKLNESLQKSFNTHNSNMESLQLALQKEKMNNVMTTQGQTIQIRVLKSQKQGFQSLINSPENISNQDLVGILSAKNIGSNFSSGIETGETKQNYRKMNLNWVSNQQGLVLNSGGVSCFDHIQNQQIKSKEFNSTTSNESNISSSNFNNRVSGFKPLQINQKVINEKIRKLSKNSLIPPTGQSIIPNDFGGLIAKVSATGLSGINSLNHSFEKFQNIAGLSNKENQQPASSIYQDEQGLLQDLGFVIRKQIICSKNLQQTQYNQFAGLGKPNNNPNGLKNTTRGLSNNICSPNEKYNFEVQKVPEFIQQEEDAPQSSFCDYLRLSQKTRTNSMFQNINLERESQNMTVYDESQFFLGQPEQNVQKKIPKLYSQRNFLETQNVHDQQKQKMESSHKEASQNLISVFNGQLNSQMKAAQYPVFMGNFSPDKFKQEYDEEYGLDSYINEKRHI